MSEATIDIGMEHDADRCLDYYRDDVLPLFRSVQTEAVTDGIVEDFPTTPPRLQMRSTSSHSWLVRAFEISFVRMPTNQPVQENETAA
jgi:hypothetical protein